MEASLKSYEKKEKIYATSGDERVLPRRKVLIDEKHLYLVVARSYRDSCTTWSTSSFQDVRHSCRYEIGSGERSNLLPLEVPGLLLVGVAVVEVHITISSEYYQM